MTDRDYAIKSMKEITFQMASHAQDYLEVTIERHYTDIKELMTSYQKLILENQIVLEELDMECQEKINEDMAYALSYLSIYSNQLNVPKMHREMNNLMIIYGLSDMIYRGMTLVKFYAPNGVMLSGPAFPEPRTCAATYPSGLFWNTGIRNAGAGSA